MQQPPKTAGETNNPPLVHSQFYVTNASPGSGPSNRHAPQAQNPITSGHIFFKTKSQQIHTSLGREVASRVPCGVELPTPTTHTHTRTHTSTKPGLILDLTPQLTTPPAANDIFLGRPNDLDGLYGQLYMDEFLFWNRAFNASAVFRLYQSYREYPSYCEYPSYREYQSYREYPSCSTRPTVSTSPTVSTRPTVSASPTVSTSRAVPILP